MLIWYKKILKNTVLIKDKTYWIKDLVEDSFKGKVEFVILANGFWVAWGELIFFDKNRFTVKKLLSTKKQSSVLKKYKQKIEIVGNNVYNLERIYLGKCNNYQIEWETGFIKDYSLRYKVFFTKIFPAKKVIKIEKKGIIIDDQLRLEKGLLKKLDNVLELEQPLSNF